MIKTSVTVTRALSEDTPINEKAIFILLVENALRKMDDNDIKSLQHWFQFEKVDSNEKEYKEVVINPNMTFSERIMLIQEKRLDEVQYRININFDNGKEEN